MDELENFEAYQQREVPREFARRAAVEVLRSSLPIARQLIGQVPDMIRDSHDAVSRTYQGAMHPELSAPGLINGYTATPTSNNPLHNTESQSSVGTANFDLPALDQPPQLSEIGQGLGATDVQSVNQLDPDFLPGMRQDFVLGESAPLILELLQNISRRLTRLEQQGERPATHPFGLLSLGSLTQPAGTHSGSLSSMARDLAAESAESLNGMLNIQGTSSGFATEPIEPANMADAGDGFPNWDDMEYDGGLEME